MRNNNLIGVKTTKIYCLPSCPARAPLPQNIVHYFPYGKWIDEGASVLLMPPQEFDFSQCLKFLARSPLEPCHRVDNNTLYKLEKFESEPVLLKIRGRNKNALCIDFLTPRPRKSTRAMVAKYVWHWFDLDTDLHPFYQMAGKNPVLKNIIKDCYGLRILTISDLFEAIMKAGELTKKKLLNEDGFQTARKELMQLHGVGRWTTDYVSLRCLKDPTAFPVDDVGLQNAVKQQLGLSKKPTFDDLRRFSYRWQNWQAYATFYLWASLIQTS